LTLTDRFEKRTYFGSLLTNSCYARYDLDSFGNPRCHVLALCMEHSVRRQSCTDSSGIFYAIFHQRKICVLLCPLDQGARLGPVSAWRTHYADPVACGFNERGIANLRYDRIGRCEDVDKAHAEPAHIGTLPRAIQANAIQCTLAILGS